MDIKAGATIIIPMDGLLNRLETIETPYSDKMFSRNYLVESALNGALRFIQLDIDPWAYFETIISVDLETSILRCYIIDEFSRLAEEIMDYLSVFEQALVEMLIKNEFLNFLAVGDIERLLYEKRLVIRTFNTYTEEGKLRQ